ncbi:MAG: hypothetical protein AAGD04_06375 [Pseudomonadota bacterium]
MLKRSGLVFVALMSLPSAAVAVPVLLDFNGVLSAPSFETNGLKVTLPQLTNSPVAYLEGGPITITAPTGTSFDLLSFDLVWSEPEVLWVSDADVAALGVDPETPQGYNAIWAANLWTLKTVENMSLLGKTRDGSVISQRYTLPLTGNTPAGQAAQNTPLPGPLAPFGTLFSDLTALEISPLPLLPSAYDFGVARFQGGYATCLYQMGCGYLVLDNIALQLNQAAAPVQPPAPVPLPASGVLALLGLLPIAFARCLSRIAPRAFRQALRC